MSQNPDPINQLIDVLVTDEKSHEVVGLIIKGYSIEEIIDVLIKKLEAEGEKK